MKVQCIFINNPENVKKRDYWLTVGKIYTVLSIYIELNKNDCSYRMIGDDGHLPAMYESKQFNIIDGKMPPNWEFLSSDNYIEITPKSWFSLGFWENFFDDEQKSLEIFKQEKEIIESSS